LTEAVAVSDDASPASFGVNVIEIPAAAALMSSTARAAAAVVAGPTPAKLPVSGRRLPMLRARFSGAVVAVGTGAAVHAVSIIADAAATARRRRAR